VTWYHFGKPYKVKLAINYAETSIKIGERGLLNLSCFGSRGPQETVSFKVIHGILLGIKTAAFTGIYKEKAANESFEPW
jgi:hypothetical protein